MKSVAQSLRPGGAGGDTLAAGQYEGLLAEGPARLGASAAETEKHHSGYLVGHVVRWLSTRGRPLDRTILGPTLYASAVAHEQAQRLLAKDDGIARAHQYAAILSERKLQAALSDSDERMLFAWLCEQAGLAVTPGVVTRLERLRIRRLEKYGWAEPDDGAARADGTNGPTREEHHP